MPESFDIKRSPRSLRSLWIALFIVMTVLMMTACAPLIPLSPIDRSIQASLLQPCARGSELTEKTGKALLQKISEQSFLLNECADAKDALNKAVKNANP